MEFLQLIEIAIGATFLALGVVVLHMRRQDGRIAHWLHLAMAFCALRAFDFIVVRAFNVDLPGLVVALDVLMLLGLIALVFGVVRVRDSVERNRRSTETSRELAIKASAEYRRALRDYTQLTRHRLANPLTAITVGIATLRDLDLGLDRETRLEVLDAMQETAARLERAILHPETVTDEESDLDAVPHLSATEVAHLMEADAVKVEQHFREINRRIIATLGKDHDGDLPFLCECWALDCTSILQLPLQRYFAIHKHGNHYVICPGHDLPSVEHVVDKGEGHWVVRKFADAVRLADAQP